MTKILIADGMDKEALALQKAYVFAARAHKGQVRRSGEPYLSHPLEVTNILADMRLDKTTLVAALLHDALEDTDITAEAELQFLQHGGADPWAISAS